ncbi:hypothetical protein ASE07_06450 [Noviherbaspirillum sp. Root189]|nr:hypothetical protein ASE07_06450 [Noviherbaspirillum sp. Root189]
MYYFYMRVPQHLVHHYGKDSIRKSLRTTDYTTAVREVEKYAQRQQAEFNALTDGKKLTPVEITAAARALAETYDLEHFIDQVIMPAREGFAKGDDDLYDVASPSEYLAPYQVEAWKILSNPQSFRLTDALHLYLKTHQRGIEQGFAQKVARDWNALVGLVGDIEFQDLGRTHGRQIIDHLIAEGKKTTTVRRTLNALSAVVKSAIRELEIQRTHPFESLRIPGEGKDAKKVVVPDAAKLKEIVEALRSDTSSATALMTLMQIELGTRIGEISGLSIHDVFLDHDTPHVYFRENPWRSLKTADSERQVPVVGIALDALKAAVALPRTGQGLFDQYARPRGNDAASAAVNKRIEKWGVTSHSFRHAMKDRLREVGCPSDIRDAIQGHANGNIAEKYGKGHTLKTMYEWLSKIAVRI